MQPPEGEGEAFTLSMQPVAFNPPEKGGLHLPSKFRGQARFDLRFKFRGQARFDLRFVSPSGRFCLETEDMP